MDEFEIGMEHAFTGGVAYAMGVVEAEKDWDRLLIASLGEDDRVTAG